MKYQPENTYHNGSHRVCKECRRMSDKKRYKKVAGTVTEVVS